MKWMINMCQRMLSRSLLNPLSWLGWAAVIAGAWWVAHLLGWRVDTAVICGTVDVARGNAYWVMMRGVLYAVTFFGAAVVCPILVLASAIYMAMVALSRRRRPAV